MPYVRPEIPGLADMLLRFGAEFRRCRHQMGMSQMQLAERSGVSQSAISRLERGLAPTAAMLKLVLLAEELGYAFPLGYCPHDHTCNWSRLDERGVPIDSRSQLRAKSYLKSVFPALYED